MPHMDMEMNGGGRTYTDYTFEHVRFTHDEARKDNNSQNQYSYIVTEPLADDGGLDPGYGAELVAMRAYAHISPDAYSAGGTPSSNQEPGSIEGRGTITVNGSSGIIEDLVSDEDDDTIDSGAFEEASGGGLGQSQDEFLIAEADDENSILWHYDHPLQVQFNDTVAGTGGGGGGNSVFGPEYLPFRERYGHGPFLDADDDIVSLAKHISNQTGFGAEISVSVTFVWDVVEIEDAREELSLPG